MWILVACLVCVAGVLYGIDKGYRPIIYFHLLLPMFAATILGGIGSPAGAVVGSFIIAFSEIILTFAWRKFLLYLFPSDTEITTLV